MIKVLESQLGYREQGNGYSKFGDWYTEHVDDSYDFSHAAWCDTFLAWGAAQAGTTATTGQFAYTPSHAAWFKKQDAWGAKPQPGALVFYDWSGGKGIGGIDHVGIVTSVQGGTIHTIEGNVDGVHAKRKVRDQSKVVGYGYPDKVQTKDEQAAPAAATAAATTGGPGQGGTATTAAAVTAPPESLAGQAAEPSAALLAVALPVIALATRLRRRSGAAASRPRGGRHARPRPGLAASA
ncbi:CHAP domain-containing protein [Spirillospora sp. NPDC050679]